MQATAIVETIVTAQPTMVKMRASRSVRGLRKGATRALLIQYEFLAACLLAGTARRL